MKRYNIILTTMLALALPGLMVAQEVLDKVVAVVDDKVILQSDVVQFAWQMAVQSGIDPQKETEKFTALQQQTLEEMIAQKVMLVQASLDSIEVNPQQVDAVLDQQIQQMVQQLGSEKRVEEYMGMPLRQVRREFRGDIEERLQVQMLREKKSREIQISRREVEAFYVSYRDSLPRLKESVKLSHILFNVEASGEAAKKAREKAEDILRQLNRGADFAELAGQYSEDPGSAKNGGDLGTVSRGNFVKEFEEVAFQLEPGEISDIVQTQFGLHIIQLQKKVGEKINARHILIQLQPSDQDEEQTVERIKAIRNEILAERITFEAAVQEYSKDQKTLETNGDLGWFEIDQLQLESFKQAAAYLKAGEISEPLKTRFGYHLVRMDERKDERTLDVDKDWEQLEEWALNLKRQQEIEKWVAEIRKNVYIEVKKT